MRQPHSDTKANKEAPSDILDLFNASAKSWPDQFSFNWCYWATTKELLLSKKDNRKVDLCILRFFIVK